MTMEQWIQRIRKASYRELLAIATRIPFYMLGPDVWAVLQTALKARRAQLSAEEVKQIQQEYNDGKIVLA